MKNFALRLPPELFAAIKASADKNYRSINNEIIFCLSQNYEAIEAPKKTTEVKIFETRSIN